MHGRGSYPSRMPTDTALHTVFMFLESTIYMNIFTHITAVNDKRAYCLNLFELKD